MTEILHFTRDGKLFHAAYTQYQGKRGPYWERDKRTEALCNCENREEDRGVLLGINQTEFEFIEHMMTQEPRYME